MRLLVRFSGKAAIAFVETKENGPAGNPPGRFTEFALVIKGDLPYREPTRPPAPPSDQPKHQCRK